MTHVADHTIGPVLTGLAFPHRRRRAAAPRKQGRIPRCRDARWPLLAAAIAGLRAARRRSVRIVDADCGAGTLLLCAVRYAQALGFTSIEARGIDKAPALVDRARHAAARISDPAIGISFETTDPTRALDEESDFPADIVLWHGPRGNDGIAARAVAAAGRTLIADPPVPEGASA